jgi:pSer/pThr/pTyr-binding forkhead associated (FHA) protein
VEDLSQGKGVYVRLIATYMLQDGDVIMMGRQTLRFHEKAEALAHAAATGTTIVNMQAMLNESIAEFVALNPQGQESDSRFPLFDQEITWGRGKGTYTFPEDGFMSGAHAKVYHRGENFFLEDSGSRNGTFVKVRGKSPVPVGATVVVGGQLLKVAQ